MGIRRMSNSNRFAIIALVTIRPRDRFCGKPRRPREELGSGLLWSCKLSMNERRACPGRFAAGYGLDQAPSGLGWDDLPRVKPRPAARRFIAKPTKLRRAATPSIVLSRSVTKILAHSKNGLAGSPKSTRVHPREHVRQFEPRPRYLAPAHIIFFREPRRPISPIAIDRAPRHTRDAREILDRDKPIAANGQARPCAGARTGHAANASPARTHGRFRERPTA